MMLPSLYGYYAGGGILTGLQVDWEQFTLNNRDITILSGSMHYFRVPKECWSDRLQKMRAAGLNTVETVVPWNLHEPEIGKYYFGNDHHGLLDIETFLKTAKEQDLFAIIKIGPIVDPNLDLGGVPSWLLRNKMYGNKAEKSILAHIRRYLAMLFFILTSLQFTNGGPIIGFYVGNEFLNYEVQNGTPFFNEEQMSYFKNYARKAGMKEFVFTRNDPIIHDKAFVPGIITAFRFHTVLRDMAKTSNSQEWMKWQNYWNRYSTQLNNTVIADIAVILNYKLGYVNFYRFIAGTTFGFPTGSFSTSHDFFPVTNSFDFGSVITETGQYNPQYDTIRTTITLVGKNEHLQKITAKINPSLKFRKDNVAITNQLSLKDALINKTDCVDSEHLIPMEALQIRRSSGQSYGFIIYRKEKLFHGLNSELRISGKIYDNVLVLINGELKAHTSELLPQNKDVVVSLKGNKKNQSVLLDIVVENCGRSINDENYKGLKTFENNVTIDSHLIKNWDIYSMDFGNNWFVNLTLWYNPVFDVPSFYKVIWIVDDPIDIYIDMQDWQKGVVILNGFVLARYLSWGPQQVMFVPASFQRKGENEIIVFECFKAGKEIRFTTKKHFHHRYRIMNSIKFNSLSVKNTLSSWVFIVVYIGWMY